MPKLKNPLFSQEARGGIAGLVYNTWRGINYCKTNTSPTGQGTALRLAAQALLKLVTVAWKGITEDARNGWRQYAIDHPVTSWTGAPMRLTGQNWFMRCNIQLKRVSMAQRNTFPNLDAPDPVVGMALTQVGEDLQLAWTTPATGEFEMDVWLVGPLSAGIAPTIQRAKFRRFALPTDFAGVILESAAATGRWTCFCRVICRNTGLVSTWISKYADIT